MSATDAPAPLIGRAEFERMQAAAEPGVRLERMDGYVYAMAGAGLAHERTVARLIVALHDAARADGCEVLGSNRRFAVGEDSDFLPDVAVYCDPTDNDDYAGYRPCLVIEVLSRSTALDDLNLKVPRYQRVASVQAIVLVNPEPLYAESFVRVDDSWEHRHHGTPEDTIDLPCPRTSIRVGDLA